MCACVSGSFVPLEFSLFVTLLVLVNSLNFCKDLCFFLLILLLSQQLSSFLKILRLDYFYRQNRAMVDPL